MNRHPGGEAQTLYLLENIEWKKEMKALDLGAGEGDTIRILQSLGMDAHGVDLFPRCGNRRFSAFAVSIRQYRSLHQPVCIFCQQRSEKCTI